MSSSQNPVDGSGSSERALIAVAQAVALGPKFGSAHVADDSAGARVERLPLPDSFHGYTLIREIHRGAQGVVYQAIQKGTKRRVAMKVMHDDPFSGPKSRVRFDREVQILAQLNHPNVVAIHDSGEVGGNYFYVMDYISGQPLDAYLDQAQLSVREVLLLFITICDAVNAAHLRGVIHRDLKPSNIRVDAGGQPYILDFGLAKIAIGEVTGGSTPMAMTLTGQFVGSMPWASPEQAAGSPDRIDVRTDVYSLGVILYQMLTRRFPYPVVGNIREVIDHIVRTEPTRPSLLADGIDDEIETIVLKCLDKEPVRRYQSAGELERDLKHYLAGEPIEAKRASTWYVLRKTLRPYRAAVAVGTLFVVMLVGFGGAMSVLYRKAAAAERRVGHTHEFFRQALAGVRPDRADRVKPVLAGLNEAADRIGEDFSTDPDAEAEVRTTLGITYQSMAFFDEAKAQLEKALALRRQVYGAQHPLVAESVFNLARVVHAMGQYAEARTFYEDSLRMQRKFLGTRHVAVAETLFELGLCLRNLGQYLDAVQAYQESLQLRRELLGDEDRKTAETMHNLAAACWHDADYDTAEPLYNEALRIRRKLLGDGHLEVSYSLNDLAALAHKRGDLQKAADLYTQSLAIRRKELAEDHPELAASLNNLAGVLRDQGDYEGALDLFRQALSIVQSRKDLEGEAHQYVPKGLSTIGDLLIQLGRLDEAETALNESLRLKRERLGDRHSSTAVTLYALAKLKLAQDDLPAAEAFAKDALALQSGVLRANHPETASTQLLLGRILAVGGRHTEAELLLRQAMQVRQESFSLSHWKIAEAQSLLGECLVALEKYAEAEPLLRSALSTLRASRGDRDALTQRALHALVRLLNATERAEEAEQLEELLTSPPDAAPQR